MTLLGDRWRERLFLECLGMLRFEGFYFAGFDIYITLDHVLWRFSISGAGTSE